MKKVFVCIFAFMFLCQLSYSQGVDGEWWPSSTDFSQEVHFWVADDSVNVPGGSNFQKSMSILSGGDQETEDAVIDGQPGKKSLARYFNVKDDLFSVWPSVPVIDVLVVYYANADSVKDNFDIHLGQSINRKPLGGNSFEALTDQFEWRVLRLDNSGEWAGNVIDPANPGGQFGGINGGTIRLKEVENIVFNMVAFGPAGAFGEPAAVNALSVGFDTESWPPIVDFTQDIHYWAAGDFLTAPEGSNLKNTLSIMDGGDQETEEAEVNSVPGIKSVQRYFNVRDELFASWPDVPVVDVLVQYYANTDSVKPNFDIHLGQSINRKPWGGYSFETVTDQFEWRLFRLDNTGQWLGNVIDPANPGGQFGGINNGTFRLKEVENIIFRSVAIGPEGAFGDPEVINAPRGTFFNPDQFSIVAEWDVNAGITNGLDLLVATSGNQETVMLDSVGPTGNQRKAVRPAFEDGTDTSIDTLMNWQILDDYLGPTSQPASRVKLVVEYYDDPALKGETFGPAQYSTTGGLTVQVPEEEYEVLQGTGKWWEAVWHFPDVKLTGFGGLAQGTPRLTFSAPVAISRVRYGMVRISGIYEKVDPIPDAYPFDPDPYQIYAELDVENFIEDGLTYGTNNADQEYSIIQTGPTNDRRDALVPLLDFGTDSQRDSRMNFAITDEWFGPTDQPNAVFKVAIEYYDDPELAGEQFGPEQYYTNYFGDLIIKSIETINPETLEGSGTWKTASWLINDMNFTGINQDPQAAVRFWFSENGAVPITRVRYAVIRPVGQYANIDPLEDVPLTSIGQWSLY